MARGVARAGRCNTKVSDKNESLDCSLKDSTEVPGINVFSCWDVYLGGSFCSTGLLEWRLVMKELLEHIAKSLVDNPDAVEVNEIEGQQTSVLELKVAKEDIGKVIGKQGRTARALRAILSAASSKLNKRAVLEILE